MRQQKNNLVAIFFLYMLIVAVPSLLQLISGNTSYRMESSHIFVFVGCIFVVGILSGFYRKQVLQSFLFLQFPFEDFVERSGQWLKAHFSTNSQNFLQTVFLKYYTQTRNLVSNEYFRDEFSVVSYIFGIGIADYLSRIFPPIVELSLTPFIFIIGLAIGNLFNLLALIFRSLLAGPLRLR